MSAQEATPRLRIEDFRAPLRILLDDGFDFAVIGGCAVGLYARRISQTVVSRDLDLLATPKTQHAIMNAAKRLGFELIKRPQPRSAQVAVLNFEGLVVDVLSSAPALHDVERILLSARSFPIDRELEIPVADAIDLLANKLQVRRDKDRPHIEILQDFLRLEALQIFSDAGATAQERARPLRRLVELRPEVFGPSDWAELAAHANDERLRRFLASRWPPAPADPLFAAAASDQERAVLREILAERERDPYESA